MKKIFFLILLILGLAILPAPSQGSTVTFDLGYVFSGTSPANPAPWLQVTIADYATNEVKITITDLDLAAGEFLGKDGVYLNINPSLLVGNPAFSFAFVSGLAAQSVSMQEDAYKADGDGNYDILFSFADANNGKRFVAGDSSVYLLTLAGVTANSFLFESTSGGGTGVYYAASHVQGLASGSAWIGAVHAVPEPLTFLLVGTGLIPFIRLRKKR